MREGGGWRQSLKIGGEFLDSSGLMYTNEYMSPESLTERQEQVLAFIRRREAGGDSPPTIREIAAHCGFASPRAASLHVESLERKGVLLRDPGKARGLRVVADEDSPVLRRRVALPLVGRIPAGLLAEAVQQAEEYFTPSELLPHRSGDFLLRVSGDSMVGDGILDGDLVLLRPDMEVSQGMIAAVCVGDEREATLKRVFFEGDQVRLRAANPAYGDVLVRAELVTFAGVFRGLVRHV